MAIVSMQCCAICDQALEGRDGRKGATREKVTVRRKDGLVVTVGWSRGGWGRRENAIDFSDEVCGDCFDKALELLQPALEFIQPRGARGALRRLLR